MRECKGCTFNQNNPYKRCVLTKLLEFNKKCPCSICLVKANCTEVCKLRSKYYYSYVGRNNIGTARSV